MREVDQIQRHQKLGAQFSTVNEIRLFRNLK